MTNEELLELAKKRFKEARDFTQEGREEALDDLNFLNGDQWPASLKAEREADGRPCLIINKVPTFVDQVVGDIRQNTPSIKVKPVDSESDPETAEIMTGLIRNIEVQSNADIAYDTAIEQAIQCGEGAFRIVTEYSDDDVFDQDICIKRIKNPFTVYWDPAAQAWDKSDAKWCFITEELSKDEFQEKYPEASMQPAEGAHDDNSDWTVDKIRVAEYFYYEEKKKKLYSMRDTITGTDKIGNEKLEGWEVIDSREVSTKSIKWLKMSGNEILEGPQDWPGKYIPIVSVYGKELNIEGKTIYRGVVRYAKDPQKLYNFSRSTSAETISLAPKVPWLITPKQIGEYKSFWDAAHKRNFPYLPYNNDPQAPGPPTRVFPNMASTGLQMEIQISDQEMHDTTGLQQASLGQKSNEKSGRAILARQREGDVANFTFYDNLGRALKYAGKVLVDLIPKIYNEKRVIRVLGEDGKDERVPINQPVYKKDGTSRIFDLTAGKYDIEVTIGPSYTTQREEAADSMMAFLGAVPAVGTLIADIVVKNFDWPGANEISERLKRALPPQLLGEQPGGPQGPTPPPPGPPPPPDPRMLNEQAKLEGQLVKNRMERYKAAQMEMGLTNETPPTQQ